MKRLTREMITAYGKYLQEQEKSKATIEKYTRDIKKFYAFLPEGKVVDKEKVCSFKNQLLTNYSAVSINSMLAAVNSFFSFMNWEEMKVKRIRLQRQVFRREERDLQAEDYKKLLRAAAGKKDERLYLIMLTMCSTGIRVSELPFITKQAVIQGRAEVACKNKTRTVLLPLALKDLLLAYVRKKGIQKGSIFITRHGNPVDRRNIWTQMKQLARVTDVEPEKIFPHNLRHLFARTYYAREKDIVKLADILGHSSMETTRIYTCTTMQEHRRRIEGLGLMPGKYAFS